MIRSVSRSAFLLSLIFFFTECKCRFKHADMNAAYLVSSVRACWRICARNSFSLALGAVAKVQTLHKFREVTGERTLWGNRCVRAMSMNNCAPTHIVLAGGRRRQLGIAIYVFK